MTELHSGDSRSARDRQLERLAATTLVVLGCALLLATCLGGFLWALDDTYVGTGTGEVAFSERLKIFSSQAVGNIALSGLVLAAGVHLRVRMRLPDERENRYADTDAHADSSQQSGEVRERGPENHDIWRQPEQ